MPGAVGFHLLVRLPDIKSLVEVLSDPGIIHADGKRHAMDSADHLTALRISGGEFLGHLPPGVLWDEATLRRMVDDRQLDPGILLQLVRNKLSLGTFWGRSPASRSS